jgi:ABC-type antimicrobial peptide transport system permease subunit
VELFQDLLADSIVISAAGGALGVLLGVLTARALPSFLFEGDAERLSFAPHLLPIFMAALVCVSVVVICGMMPMAGTVTDRPWMVLQRETGSPSRAILRLRSALVVAQITACCMLVVCTVVLRAGLDSALETGAGKRLENPVLLTVQALPLLGPEIEAGYFEEVAKKMTMLNGMRPLAWTARLPGNQPNWRNFRIQQPSLQFRDVSMDISWLTPESVQSLDRQPVAGKVFGVNDQRYKAVVVNEEAAAALFGNQTVGMVIRDASDLPIEIVGIVKKAATQSTVRSKSSTSAGQKSRTIYYGYLNQAEAPNTIRNADFRVPVGPPEANIELNANVVSGNYFSALGMPLVAGQRFSDARIPGEGRVAVINQEAADLYFNGNAVGSGVIDDTGLRTEIIGVAKSQTFGTFEQHAEPTIYFPLSQDCPARMTLLMKASKWNSGMAAGLRQKVQEVPGGSSGLIGVTTLNDQLAQSSLAPLRIAMLIGAVSAGMALILGILGLLNTQTDAERQRQRDRAVRIALGAQRWRIVLLVMNTAGRLALCGAMIGVLLSFATIRILIADVATVSPSLQVWLIAPLLPVAAVIAASLIPARRASVVAPARIMRDI